MTINYDEKGKIFTEIISKEAVKARIQTTKHEITGNVHVRRDARFKDELDVKESFLAVTDACVLDSEKEELFHTRFIAVQREQIIWITPVEDIIDGGGSC